MIEFNGAVALSVASTAACLSDAGSLQMDATTSGRAGSPPREVRRRLNSGRHIFFLERFHREICLRVVQTC